MKSKDKEINDTLEKTMKGILDQAYDEMIQNFSLNVFSSRTFLNTSLVSNFGILARISKNKRRPLVLKLNNKELINLYKERVKFYKLSDFKTKCEKKSKNEIIKQISKIIKNENFTN